MTKRKTVAIAASVALTAAVAVGSLIFAAPASTGATPASGTLIRGAIGGDFDSELPAVSTDGRFVAFVSLADNLVPGDTNGASDIFVRGYRDVREVEPRADRHGWRVALRPSLQNMVYTLR